MATEPSQIFDYFARYIKTETGIIYTPDNAYQLNNRLEEICKALGLAGPDQLHAKAVTEGIHGAFKQLLLDVATNNETSFFRDPKLFSAFEKHVIPSLASRVPRPTVLRIWSVASSFGQEAYSIAMILAELEAAKVSIPFIEILTTDISTRALERVKAAKYSQLEVQRGLPASMLVKYFDPLPENEWQLKPEIRRRVKSARVNLLDISGVTGTFDVIFCRNVLIYQSDVKKRELIAELATYLSPGGYFILGAAESLIGLSTQFDQVALGGAIFYKKK